MQGPRSRRTAAHKHFNVINRHSMLPRSRWLRTVTLVLLVSFTLATQAKAQTASCSTESEGIPVGMQGLMCADGPFNISLAGEVASGQGFDCNGLFDWTPKVWPRLIPDKTYTVSAGSAICVTTINFDVPEGYVLYIDGHESKTIEKSDGGVMFSGDGSWSVVLRRKCKCGKDTPGSAISRLGSVVWEAGIGTLVDGRSAEHISIREEMLTANSYTPNVLIYSPPAYSSAVEVVRTGNGSLRQIKAPQAFADVVTINSSEFEIRYYSPANVGTKVGGIYQLTGQPYVTWKVTNPEPSSTKKLQIIKYEAGQPTDKTEYIWDPAVDSWTMSTGWSQSTGYSRVETKTVTFPTSTSRTETFVVKEGASPFTVVSKNTKTYLSYPWGEELVQEVVDPEASALTTTYTYYENPVEERRYRKVKSITFPNGSWEKYDYDFFFNISMILRPWKDQAMATATEANSHATLYGYSNSDNGVVGISHYARIPFDTEEKIQGVTVRKTRLNRNVVSTTPDVIISTAVSSYSGSNNGVPVNLIQETITTAHYQTSPEFLRYRVLSVQYPDGRKDTYSYEKGNYLPNANPSLSHFVPDDNGLAERVTIVHGNVASPQGVAFKTTKDVTVRDQNGNEVLKETYVYDGSGYERVIWQVMDHDSRGHLIVSRNNKGESTSAVWIGEHKVSEIDADGIEMVYTYDSLGRVASQTKKGVAATGGFPGQNDIVITFTYDADGRQKSQTETGATVSLSNSRVYDKAGRLIRETDPAMLVSVYAYQNGGRTQTVTRPGGATEVSDNYLDGEVKSFTGSAVVPRYFDYGVNGDGTRYQLELIGSAGFTSPRWIKTTTDWIDRTVSVEKPGFTGSNIVESFTFNALGQLKKKVITANTTKLLADTLYEYDEVGQQTRKGLDVDNNGSLTLTSTDRISETESVYEKTGNDWFQVTAAKTYLIDNNSTPVVRIERTRMNNFSLNGNQQTVAEITHLDVAGNVTKTVTQVDRSVKKKTTTTDTPHSNIDAVAVTVNGLLQSKTNTTPQTATTYTYDALGRQLTMSDSSTWTNVRTYNSDGRVQSLSMGGVTVSYDYYPQSHVNAGRVKSQTDTFNKKTYFAYSNRGEVIRTWGDTTYPIEYVYDAYSQRTELRTFRSGQNWRSDQWPATSTGGADVTRWSYQESTGLVTQKQDAAQKAMLYTYDELGRVKTRTWARGITCTLGYDGNTGELLTMSYSDNTPAISFTYDRGGRQVNVSDAAGLHTRTFNAVGGLQTEQITNGILHGVGMTIGYDNFLRRNTLQTSLGANALSGQTYGYDLSSRLETVTSGNRTATHTYHPNTGLLNTTTFPGGTTIARGYDISGRLQTINLAPAADAPQSYTYTYNDLNQRTRVTRENGAYWSYIYNDRGELVSGRRYWSDNSPVWGAQTEYDFDNVGNRTSARTGGNQLGSLRHSTYSTNSLNQYSQRTVPGFIDVTGTANTVAVVSVNNQTVARKAEYFYKELPVDNSSAPVHQQISVVGARNNFGAGGEDAVTEKGGRLFVPQAQEILTYDDDGNLSSDARWNYTWDAENRLLGMESVGGVPAEAKQKMEFAYDHLSRRIQKKAYRWNTLTSSFELHATTRFIYDGWDLVAEYDDVTGLARNFAHSLGSPLFINEGNETYIAASDANQNVTHLVKLSTAKLSATYDYDPFGNLLQATGDYASKNPFRFAGKYFDAETGLIYYGHRYYDSQRGRWTTRDPIAEAGGLNLYAALSNDPINRIDPDGRRDWAGSEILIRLYKGGGEPWYIVGDTKWADYMMSPARRDLGLDTFRLGVATRLRVIATRVLDRNVPDGHAFVVTEQFDAAFPNSESITGYGFLHHTNSDVGDFKINGVGTKVTGQSSKDECQEVNFRVVYQWNDRIDPNFSYWTDYLKWFGLKVLYWTGQSRNPMPYNIHISWSQESTYRIAGKKEISTGWPLGAQGSPPR